MEEGLHVDAQGFVVAVDAGPVGGFAAHPGAADAGQDGCDDVVAQCQESGDGAGCWCGDLVAVGSTGFDDEFFTAEFAQVVGGVTNGVVGVPGDRVHPGGHVGDGEAARRGDQGEYCAQRGAGPWFVQVDSADAGGADLGR